MTHLYQCFPTIIPDKFNLISDYYYRSKIKLNGAVLELFFFFFYNFNNIIYLNVHKQYITINSTSYKVSSVFVYHTVKLDCVTWIYTVNTIIRLVTISSWTVKIGFKTGLSTSEILNMVHESYQAYNTFKYFLMVRAFS